LAQVATEPEEQARHLALASIGPDPEVLAALDAAASTAARRGAPADAAELLEHACALDPGGATTPGRQVGAAEHRLASGDLRRAAEVLDEVLAHAATGRTVPAALARAHAARATLSQLEGDLGTAAEGFRRAIECSEDPDQRTSALLSLVFLLTNTGALGEARHLLEADADRARPAPALAAAQDATTVMVGYLTGEPIDWGRLDAAVAVELQAGAASVPTTSRPLLVASLLLHMAGRLEEAVGCCERLQDALAAEGDEAALALVDFWVSWIWGGLGRLDELEAKVDAAAERARAFGAPGRVAAATTASATLAAWRGDAARCVADAQTAIAALGPGSPPSVWAIAARGLLELGRGDHEAALEQYQPLLFVAEVMGLHQGTAAWWTPELIEVLTALGRAEEARALLGRYDVRAFGDRAGDARAVALRCAGLVAEAEGDLDGAERSLEAAIAEHAAGGSPLARARSELHLGALLRRRGQRRAARSHLEAAHSTFDAVGARGWADRARTELDRLGLRPSHDGSLTPAERSVARLVAEGLSNKAIATRLHTSAKTVEAHLTRAYRKVGVRRRAELAVLVARDPERFAERPD
jgi:DNA-binding CsgD family transcriptional regulator